MNRIRIFWARLRGVFGKGRMERELHDELSFHFEQEVDLLVSRGATPAEARNQARKRFGGLDRTKEACRDASSLPRIDELFRDLRHAARTLWHSPAFSLIAIASLAVGIGGTTAIFSLMDQALYRPLPVAHPEQLVALETAQFNPGMLYSGDSALRLFSYPMYRDLRDATSMNPPVLDGIIARTNRTVTVADPHGGDAEAVEAEIVSGNFFDVLGVTPAAGRLLTQQDDVNKGGHPVVVLSYAFWTRRFGGDPGVVGQTLRINSTPMTIIGVAPDGFYGVSFGPEPDLYAPMMMKAELTPTWDALEDRHWSWLHMIGRLHPGVTAAQASAAIQATFHTALEAEFDTREEPPPPTQRANILKTPLEVIPSPAGVRTFREQSGIYLYILMAMMTLVLVIAAINLASLLTARSFARNREVAIRMAVGAGRFRLIRQFLAESVLLALLGAACGLGVAVWLNNWILVTAGPEAAILSAGLDARTLLFAFGLGAVTGIAIGILPALQATRVTPQPSLQIQSHGTTGGLRQIWLKQALLTTQVAVSMALLVTSGLFARSLINLRDLDPGFRTTNVALFTIDASLAGYELTRVHQLYEEIPERIAALPGVEAAALGDVMPLDGSHNSTTVRTVEGREFAPGENTGFNFEAISPGFFHMMGVKLLGGHDISAHDRFLGQRVAVVNQSFAERFFGGVDQALGGRFGTGPEADIEIVGVSADFKYAALREPIQPTAYFAVEQSPTPGATVVHVATSVPVTTVMPALRRTMKEIDPNVTVQDLHTMEEQVAYSLLPERLISTICAVGGLLAVLLAAVGLYGVTSFTVQRRTREIGIRMALGAAGRSVLGMVLRGLLATALIGILIGLPLALMGARLIEAQLYGVSTWDPLTLVGAVLLIGLVSVAAGWLPAMQAAQLDPMKTLQSE